MIRYQLITEVIFEDGTTHKRNFLITKLHPKTPIVLGLPWLREYNPRIDWKNLKLSLQDDIMLSAAMVKDIPCADKIFPSIRLPPEHLPTTRNTEEPIPRKQNFRTNTISNRVTIEEIPDEIEVKWPGLKLEDPLLIHVDELEDYFHEKRQKQREETKKIKPTEQ